jgi:hypothetical protein
MTTSADATFGPKVHEENGGDALVVEPGGEFALLSGATFTGNGAVTAEALKTTLRTGIIQFPLAQMRIVSANDIAAVAATSGVPGKDTAPIFERVNGATDKALRLKWAASSSVEIILGQFEYPPDLDDTATVVIKILCKSGGATDTPTVAIGYFESIGDTNAGGNTAAITSSVAQRTVTIAAVDVGPAPIFAVATLTPGAHTTDTFELYAAWAEYSRV